MGWLEREQGIRSDQVVLYGRSLGGGPTCHLASTVPRGVRGVILQSTFTSALRVLLPATATAVSSSPGVTGSSSSSSSPPSRSSSPSPAQSPRSSFSLFPSFLSAYTSASSSSSSSSSSFSPSLSGDIFHNLSKVSVIESPIFVIHGISDEVIHFSHGEVNCASFHFSLLFAHRPLLSFSSFFLSLFSFFLSFFLFFLSFFLSFFFSFFFSFLSYSFSSSVLGTLQTGQEQGGAAVGGCGTQ